MFCIWIGVSDLGWLTLRSRDVKVSRGCRLWDGEEAGKSARIRLWRDFISLFKLRHLSERASRYCLLSLSFYVEESHVMSIHFED